MDSIAIREFGKCSHASRGSLKALIIATGIVAAGTAQLSCAAQRSSPTPSSTDKTVYEPSAPLIRAPLPPPENYVPPAYSANPEAPYESSLNKANREGGLENWVVSPRWTAVQGDGCILVEQDQPHGEPQSRKFKVKDCSEEEVGNLTSRK